MKSFLYLNIILLTVLSLTSCQDELIDNPGQYAKIYMPQAVDLPAQRNFVMADTLQTILFGGAFGGVGAQSQQIDVNFAVAPELVDSYNTENGTSYQLMPEGSYELVQTKATIPAGKYNTDALEINVTTVGALEPLQEYLLPVTIEGVAPDIALNEDLQTTYFLIKGVYQYFDRSTWQVIDVSSEEPPNIDSNVLDGNNTTSWHTAWKGGTPPHPHYIVIDMMEVKSLHGFYFWPHNTARTGNPTDITIEVSIDGTTWQTLGDFDLVDDFMEQIIYLDKVTEARYFRVTINASSGNKAFTHPTEIGAF